MEITGRLTADAEVKHLSEDRQIVNFSIAINDSYKPKNGEVKEVTTYVDCAYWLSPKIAEWLKKGALVQLSGRIGMNVYINHEGNAVGRINFHVNSINILAFAKRQEQQERAEIDLTVKDGASKANAGEHDDLPF